MKKFTNKILIATGIILLVCNIVLVSCSLSRYAGDGEDSYDMYDEYYYDDDDYIMDDERY
jgi:hypothetical protein